MTEVATIPFACDCENGKFIVLFARDADHAAERLAAEYGTVALSMRKVTP